MPPRLSALKVLAKSQNGVGAFILQCKRLEFHYCDWGGSSKGMNTFLKTNLTAFASENPQIEITVSPRPNKHPLIRAHYINGKERDICVRNLDNNQILQKTLLLRDANGNKNVRFKAPVESINESVRGVWSPYHGASYKI